MRRVARLAAALLVASAAGAGSDAYACDPDSSDRLVRTLAAEVSDSPDHPYSIEVSSNPPITFRRFFVRTGAMTGPSRWRVDAHVGPHVLARTEVDLPAGSWAPVDLGRPVDGRAVTLDLRPVAAGTRGEFLFTTSSTDNGFRGLGVQEVAALSLLATGGDALVILEREGVREYRAPADCGPLEAAVGNAYERPQLQGFVTVAPGEVATQHFVTGPDVGRFEVREFTVLLGSVTASSVAWKWERAGGSHTLAGTFTPVAGRNSVTLPSMFVSVDGTSEANDFLLSLQPLDGTVEVALRSAAASGPCEPAARATIGGSLSFAQLGATVMPESDLALNLDGDVHPPWRSGYLDVDGDGFGTRWPDPLIPAGSLERVADRGNDCDDADPAISPVAEEICDGKENRCRSSTTFASYAGDGRIPDPPACPLTLGVCGAANQQCVEGAWQACSAASYGPDYEEVEARCDGKDNDCDGEVDEDCLRATTSSAARDPGGCGCTTSAAGPQLLALAALLLGCVRRRGR